MENFSRLLAFVGLLFLSGFTAVCQTISSAQPGPWNNTLTWNGGVIPNASNSTSILVNHNITIPSGFSAIIDQTVVNTGVSLTVNTGGNLNVGAGVDAVLVNGVLIGSAGSTITGTDGTNLRISNTGTYRHLFTTTEGILPLAKWDALSIMEIAGYTTFTNATAGGRWNQNFGRVNWNCTSQSAVVNLTGRLVFTGGDFNIQSTGTSVLQLSSNENPTISVGGNLQISGTSQVIFATTGATPGAVINIAGNLVHTSTNATGVRLASTGLCTLNVANDLSMNATGGVLNLSTGSGGRGILNITGDFGLTNGTITESGGGVSSGSINFLNNSVTEHTFSNTGTISNRIAYSIAADNTLRVVGESQVVGNANSSLTVLGNLIIESTDAAGALQTGSGASTTSGNIRVVTRTYDVNSTVTYGATTAQFMGTAQSGITSTTIIDNAAGVSVMATASVTVNGNMMLQTGNLNISNASMAIAGNLVLNGGDVNFTSIGTTRGLTISGNTTLDGGEIVVTSGTANANVTIAGDLLGSNFIGFTGANSNLIINGSGPLSIDFPLPGATTLETITVTRSGGTVVFPEDITVGSVTINNGSIDMNANLTLIGDLNLATGTTLFFEDYTLELNGRFNNSLTGGLLSSNSGSILNVTGTNTLGTLNFSGTGNTLDIFSLDRPSNGNIVTLNSPLTVNSTFDLLDGVFVNTSGLSLGSGAILTRDASASMTGSIPAGGPYDLVYTGNNLTTGVEARGSLTNITSDATGVVTLGSAIVASGDLTINSGTLTSGVNAISAGTVLNSGVLNAPSSTFSIGGSFTNDGTFSNNAGTVLFSGTSSVSGTTNPTFRNFTISSGTFTSPSTLNVTGAFVNNGTFDHAGGTVAFLGTAGVTQLVSGSSITDFNSITVANTSANPDVQIQSKQNLFGILTLAMNAIFDADGSANTSVFTLKSTADAPTEDASIATLPAGAQVTGDVTIERFMTIEGVNGGRIYRYISSPVQNAPVSDMQNEIKVTGSFTGTSVCSYCSANQSMFQYDENVIIDTNGSGGNDFNDGYSDFPSNANSETFTPGRGYAMFVPGDHLATALWDLRGPINRGNVTPVILPSTFTNSGVAANDGWNLVGNPYPSTIDWNAASGWTKTNVGGTIYIRDNSSIGQFATWNGTVPVNGGSRYIPIGQAFWIQATAAPTLRANENVKVAGQQTTFFREQALTNVLRITLVKGTSRDETVIHFRSDAKAEYDIETDSRKMLNSSLNLSSVLATGEDLAINSSPFVCSQPIKLKIANVATGPYRLDFSEFETFGGTIDITLVDNFLNKTIDVVSSNQYVFDVTTNPLSSGSNRFAISFSEKTLSAELQFEAQDICQGENASLSILNSRTDVNYMIMKDGLAISNSLKGNGATIKLSVNKENLTVGSNNIIIQSTSETCLNTKGYQGSIVVNSFPTILSTSPGKICREGSVTLSASALNSGDSYKWYQDEVSDIVLSATSEYKTPVISKSRTYYVSALSTSGCINNSRIPVTAEVIQFDDALIIQTPDGSLQSNYAEGNKWFYNGAELTGATTNTIIPEKSGVYKVEVSTLGCSSSFEYEFSITAADEQGKRYSFSVYPNPVDDKAFIDVPENKSDISRILLYNTVGDMISEASWVKDEVSRNKKAIVDMSTLPAGMYIIRVIAFDRIESLKIYKK